MRRLIIFLLFISLPLNLNASNNIKDYENEARLLIEISNQKQNDFEVSSEGQELLNMINKSQNKSKDFFNAASGGNLNNQTEPNVFVFISFNMPLNLIYEYIEEAKHTNALLVLRGFLKNKDGKFSVPETAKKIMEITKEKGGSIIIHPEMFDKFGVNLVPSIVRINENYECTINGGMCQTSPSSFDKITGSVSIRYALETFNNEK